MISSSIPERSQSPSSSLKQSKSPGIWKQKHVPTKKIPTLASSQNKTERITKIPSAASQTSVNTKSLTAPAISLEGRLKDPTITTTMIRAVETAEEKNRKTKPLRHC
jgi:hypothetical protein